LTAPGVVIDASRTSAEAECAVNRGTPGAILIRGFGASDCRAGCGSHLKFLGPDPSGWETQMPMPTDDPEPADTIRLVPALARDAERLAEMSLDIWQRHYVPDVLTHDEILHFWNRGYRPEAIRREMAAGGVLLWIESEGERIGFVGYREEPGQRRLWLSKLYLLPEHHGHGIGAYTLREIERTAARLGLAEICLYVFRKNQQAISAYRRAGFVIAREDLCDAGDGYFYDDYVMSLTLAAGRIDDAPPAR
jgi:diamine N-acetyltransferase